MNVPFTFCNKQPKHHGDAAYTVDDFLEAVQRHDKMQTHTKQKTPLALLGNPHGANEANKSKLRLCANPGCKKKDSWSAS